MIDSTCFVSLTTSNIFGEQFCLTGLLFKVVGFSFGVGVLGCVLFGLTGVLYSKWRQIASPITHRQQLKLTKNLIFPVIYDIKNNIVIIKLILKTDILHWLLCFFWHYIFLMYFRYL